MFPLWVFNVNISVLEFRKFLLNNYFLFINSKWLLYLFNQLTCWLYDKYILLCIIETNYFKHIIFIVINNSWRILSLFIKYFSRIFINFILCTYLKRFFSILLIIDIQIYGLDIIQTSVSIKLWINLNTVAVLSTTTWVYFITC